jgi:hypothetical protein
VTEKEANAANPAGAADSAAFNYFVLTTFRNNPFVFMRLEEMTNLLSR